MFPWSPFAEPYGAVVVLPPFDHASPVVVVVPPEPDTLVPSALDVTPDISILIVPLPPVDSAWKDFEFVDFNSIVSLFVDFNSIVSLFVDFNSIVSLSEALLYALNFSSRITNFASKVFSRVDGT